MGDGAVSTSIEEPAQRGQRPSLRLASLRFLGRRLGFYVLTLWAAITLNFVVPLLMPGDPGLALLRSIQNQTGQPATPAQIAGIRAFYGDPRHDIVGQHLRYWRDLSRLNFCVSISHYPTPVIDLVAQALPWTLLLVGVTTVLAWVIGTLLGAYPGWNPGGRLDSILHR